MKKILKSICFSVLAFLFAIGSLFIPITSNNTKSAHADNTSGLGLTFNSSNIIYSVLGNRGNSVPALDEGDFSSLLYVSGNSDDVNAHWFNWSFKIEMHTTDYIYDIPVSVSPYFKFYALGKKSNTVGVFPSTSSGIDWVEIGETPSISTLIPLSLFTKCLAGSTSNRYWTLLGSAVLPPEPYLDPSTNPVPSLEMVSIELGNYYDLQPYREFLDTVCSNFTNSNIVVYTDSSGYKYFFFIPCMFDYSNSIDGYIDYRKYYTDNSLDFSNNEYYSEGVTYGESIGYNNGYNVGYREGSSVGYENGFEEGRLEGALNANNYSFFGLISAIIDAPVKVLTSLFNFNFLGVNLWAFFTSILTISLIIFVIRKFMAKG